MDSTSVCPPMPLLREAEGGLSASKGGVSTWPTAVGELGCPWVEGISKWAPCGHLKTAALEGAPAGQSTASLEKTKHGPEHTLPPPHALTTLLSHACMRQCQVTLPALSSSHNGACSARRQFSQRSPFSSHSHNLRGLSHYEPWICFGHLSPFYHLFTEFSLCANYTPMSVY